MPRVKLLVVAAIAGSSMLVGVACSVPAEPTIAGSVRTSAAVTTPTTTPETAPGTAPHDDPGTAPATTGTTTATAPGDPGPPVGSASIGDARFPELGSADIDVEHYDVAIEYDPERRLLDSTVVASLTLRRDTDRVSLDLDGPEVGVVSIDDVPTRFTAGAGELVIELGTVRSAGSRLDVTVTSSVTVDDQQFDQGGVGLFPTDTGLWAVNEPDGTSTWLPVDDHPLDKATWTFAITVPVGTVAIANGALRSRTARSGHTTWTWDQTEPMASYLITLLVGDYDLVDGGVTDDGTILAHAVLADRRATLDPYLALTEDQLTFFEQWFGPYPFDRYGISITDSAPGLAMEAQGLSLFSSSDLDGSLGAFQHLLTSHELAHQWFGDAVSPASWDDIWLNEGSATYAQWMWLDEAGFDDVASSAELALRSLPDGGGPVSHPVDLFGSVSYDGGAVALHALRRTIGDDAFFSGLQAWVRTHIDGAAGTDDFRTVMEQASGEDLSRFFADWIDAATRPASFPPAKLTG